MVLKIAGLVVGRNLLIGQSSEGFKDEPDLCPWLSSNPVSSFSLGGL